MSTRLGAPLLATVVAGPLDRALRTAPAGTPAQTQPARTEGWRDRSAALPTRLASAFHVPWVVGMHVDMLWHAFVAAFRLPVMLPHLSHSHVCY